MTKKLFVILAVVFLLAAATCDWILFETRKPVNFSEWTSGATAEELDYVGLQKGYGISTVHYDLTEQEKAEFCAILNAIQAKDCKVETQYSAREELRISVLRNNEYWIFQLLEEPRIYVLFDTEQGSVYGVDGSGKYLVIDNRELWNYVVNKLENAKKE